MTDREKVIDFLQHISLNAYEYRDVNNEVLGYPYLDAERIADDALALLKEQDELLKHEYWRGYNNGRADERGLQEGTIMQTFSPD